MRRLHLVGRRNHGKTTLIAELVPILRARGLSVGTIKHSGHDHELDHEGKDSWQHGMAGASPAAVVTPESSAVFLRHGYGHPDYDGLEPLFGDLDLVLVEGDIEASAPRVEIWRAALSEPPLAATVPGILAIITDDAPPLSLPRWPRHPVEELVDRLLATL